MVNRDYRLITLILKEILDIGRYTNNIDEEQFMLNDEKQKAVCLSFQNIGEYVHKLSPEFKVSHSGIDWTDIYGFRNIVAHHYAKVKMTQVWYMVLNDLPQLKVELEKI